MVLIANDQEWSARSIESILSPNGFRVLRAYTGQQALERAFEANPHVIILDAQMPDMHGFEVCRALRSDPRIDRTTPIVVTTAGPSGRAQRIEAYDAGAWEFLGQPLDGEALLLKLRTFVAVRLEVERLRDESLLDVKTGLYNRRGLARRARELGSDAARRHEPLACVVLGADDSSIGAMLPDDGRARLSEWVGEVLRRTSRASDAVGRLGSMEYGVVAPGAGTAGAVRLADRIETALETELPPGLERPIRLQAGYCAVADFADSPVDALELLLRATTALHDLQKDGASERIRAFEPTDDYSN
ncbi:MAG TPA: response regulator [Gemmatimonadales bacterium]|nr:response regulator [Gemmatimonadales bacterium]